MHMSKLPRINSRECLQQRMRLISCQQLILGNTSFTLLLRQWLGLMADECALRPRSQLGNQMILLIETLFHGGFQKPRAREPVQGVIGIEAQDFQ